MFRCPEETSIRITRVTWTSQEYIFLAFLQSISSAFSLKNFICLLDIRLQKKITSLKQEFLRVFILLTFFAQLCVKYTKFLLQKYF